MMLTRFSFSLPRIFRLRSRRGVKASADSAQLTQRFSTEPSRRPDPPQLKPINTTVTPPTNRPRTSLFRSLLSPIAQSPITTPHSVTPIPDALSPVLIIGRDPVQPALQPLTAPTAPSDVGPQTHVEASLPEPLPVPSHPNSRGVSFQVLTTHAEELPESPLSRSSTLISDVEAHALAQAEIGPVVSPEQRRAVEAPDSGSVRAASDEPGVGLDDATRSGSGKVRPASLSIPQRVRVNVSRLSLPVMRAAPVATANTDAGDGKRKSKRVSLTTLMSGSGSTKKEKRPSWLSRELSKPETQEVLAALAYVM